MDRNYHLRHLDQLVVVLWPNKSVFFDFSKTRRSQKAPIKASPIIIPFNFSFPLFSKPKKQNQQKPIGHWEPSRIFLSNSQQRKSNGPPARIKRPRSRRRNFKRKPKPKAPERCFWPRILTKKPMEKEADAKVESQHFYFCCRARHL